MPELKNGETQVLSEFRIDKISEKNLKKNFHTTFLKK